MGQILVGDAAHEKLGRSLDLSKNGQRLAAGASQSKGTGPGFVKVWDFNGTWWNQIGQTLVGDNLPDVFGRDVDLSEDGMILACGANLANVSGVENSGMVRVFQYDEGKNLWQQIGGDILGSDGEDRLGTSVSLSEDGKIIAIGASQIESGAGYVRIFDFNNATNQWDQLGEDLVGDQGWEKVGTEVSLSKNGRAVAVGGAVVRSVDEVAAEFRVFDLGKP